MGDKTGFYVTCQFFQVYKELCVQLVTVRADVYVKLTFGPHK